MSAEKESGLRSAPISKDYFTKKQELSRFRSEISLREGGQPFGVHPEVARALEIAISESSFINNLEQYSVSTAQAEHYIRDRHGISEKPGIFFNGTGSNGIINRLPDLLPPPPKDSQIFVVGPAFQNIFNAAERFRKDENQQRRFLHANAIGDYGLDTTLEEALVIAMSRREKWPFKNRALMWYLCNPGTPKGDSASLDAINEFVSYSAKKGDAIVIDEAFGDVMPDVESAITLTDKYKNLAVLRSASKIIGLPGLRLGWMVAGTEIAQKYERLVQPNELPVQTALIANKILDPELMKLNSQSVIEKTLNVKLPLVKGLEDAGFHVYPTDLRVPVMLVEGGKSDFIKRLNLVAVNGVGGSGYSLSFPEVTSEITGLIKREGITDKQVRITVPASIDLVTGIIDRFKEARDLPPISYSI